MVSQNDLSVLSSFNRKLFLVGEIAHESHLGIMRYQYFYLDRAITHVLQMKINLVQLRGRNVISVVTRQEGGSHKHNFSIESLSSRKV